MEQPKSAGPVFRHRRGGGLDPDIARHMRELRGRLAATAAAVARTEEEVARVREELAELFPSRAAYHLHEAEMARAEAARAYDFARSLGGQDRHAAR